MPQKLLEYQPRSLDVIVFRGQWYNPFLPPILFRTGSRWTHTVVVRGSDGKIYDAHTPGVQERHLSDYKGRYAAVLRRRDIDQIPQADKIKMIAWADKLVKDENGYDFTALVGYLLGIKAFEDDDRWFCSELPYWMWEYHGYPLYNEQLTYVLPSDHYRCRAYKIIAEGVVP
jgi:hypothetical protein